MQRKPSNPTIEYLNQAYILCREINHKRQQIAKLQELAQRATSTYEALRISGTKNVSKLENNVAKIVDIGAALEKDVAAFGKRYREVQATIEAVENPRHRELLSLRYLSFKRWREVAEAMGKEEHHVTHYIHPKALQSVAEVLRST